MNYDALKNAVLKIKERIVSLESQDTQLSETDTRQGLINPLFRALGWDFTDFASIKSEVRITTFNEPVDYAFYSSAQNDKPILLMEAKRLATPLSHKSHIKQLTGYLGAMGVQWGVLTDGNRYVLYNSRGGDSFEDQKFLTLEIKTVDTDSGFAMDDFIQHLSSLLSRECLENEDIQKAYEVHMINTKIKAALDSLLTKPFDTLVSAIKREFKEERVGAPVAIRIKRQHIMDYLESIADEVGRIAIDLEAEEIHKGDAVEDSILETQAQKDGPVRAHGKRVTIEDLLKAGVVKEGDQWRLSHKGDFIWGRIEGNGQLEVNGERCGNPSKAFSVAVGAGGNGWYYWQYKDDAGEWQRVDELRKKFRAQAHKGRFEVIGDGAAAG